MTLERQMQPAPVFFAGLASGVAGTLPVPFHLAATLQQASPIKLPVRSIFANLFSNEGVHGLLRGSHVFCGLYAPATALFFTSYFQAQRLLTNDVVNSEFARDFVCGSIALTLGSVLYTPNDNIMQQVWVRRESARQVASSIYSKMGVRGFYRGFPATYAVWAPLDGAFFAVYETLKRVTGRLTGNREHVAIDVCNGIVASSVGVLVTNPLDIVRVRYQLSGLEVEGMQFSSVSRRSALHMALHVFRTEPTWMLFSRGLIPRLMAIVPDLTSGIVIFEFFYRRLASDAPDEFEPS